ncbi:MAG: hypothetical protein EP299_12660 [Acidobacteria bacterium]|nr:MAG: hypothetical protein EP299_12660 [Acidobacteriota bacterium]
MSHSADTLIELMSGLLGLKVEMRRSDAALAAALVATSKNRKLLLVERTYRDGVGCIVDPTTQEIETAREGNLWDIWNSERAVLLRGVV